MPKTRRLLHEEITLSQAKEREDNVLHQLSYHDKQTSFFALLHTKQADLKTIVAHHLGLRSTSVCQVADSNEWLCGSFNVSVPVTIRDWKNKEQQGNTLLLRFPLPHRLGGLKGDEKVRCEAGAYAWLQEGCPDVPIPRLYGFAVSTGETYTHIDNLPFLSRCFQLIRRRFLTLFGLQVPSSYVRHPTRASASVNAIGAGYLLIEKIEDARGMMLSHTWSRNQDNQELRANFFRDLSKILLRVSRIPLTRIGSFVIDNEGFLALSNRPLSIEIANMENEKIPIDIPQDYTYLTIDSYLEDMLRVHDSRLRYQPNAVNNIPDCAYQMSALAAMRTAAPLFFRSDFRRGPFVFTLTDLHQSNIFVDENWHITCLVDLEWASSRPIEMVEPPYWLSNQGVDQIDVKKYDILRSELMAILAAEQSKLYPCPGSADSGNTMPCLSKIMEESWVKGTFWYTLALSSPSGLFRIFYEHIQPLLSEHCAEDIGEIMPFYWVKDVGRFVASKLSDKKKYDHDLQLAFEEHCLDSEPSTATDTLAK